MLPVPSVTCRTGSPLPEAETQNLVRQEQRGEGREPVQAPDGALLALRGGGRSDMETSFTLLSVTPSLPARLSQVSFQSLGTPVATDRPSHADNTPERQRYRHLKPLPDSCTKARMEIKSSCEPSLWMGLPGKKKCASIPFQSKRSRRSVLPITGQYLEQIIL